MGCIPDRPVPYLLDGILIDMGSYNIGLKPAMNGKPLYFTVKPEEILYLGGLRVTIF